jgi:hypothetical protein
MTFPKFLGLGALIVSLAAFGCGKPAEPSKADTKNKQADADHDDHDHGEGPHGGLVLELGKYHGEFTVDHGKKQATVYILDGKVKNAVPVATEELKLVIKSPAFEVVLVPTPLDGETKEKCSRFVATHDNFGKEQEFEGNLVGKIEKKPYAVDFKEEEHKDHDHGKEKGKEKK